MLRIYDSRKKMWKCNNVILFMSSRQEFVAGVLEPPHHDSDSIFCVVEKMWKKKFSSSVHSTNIKLMKWNSLRKWDVKTWRDSRGFWLVVLLTHNFPNLEKKKNSQWIIQGRLTNIKSDKRAANMSTTTSKFLTTENFLCFYTSNVNSFDRTNE